jgi:sigma-B regulation protein RsbU (phosphoserine phosphatase)
MLRELVDIAWLEDFVRGYARSAGLRIAAYDARGGLVSGSEALSEYSRLTGEVLEQIPVGLQLVPAPSDAPPAHVGFTEQRGVCYVVAPIYVDGQTAGYVAVGEFRDHSPAGHVWQTAQQHAGVDLPRLIAAWEHLPKLDRGGGSQAIFTSRWAARMLAERCRRETQLQGAAAEIALVGDIAELLHGQQDLQKVLDRIVAETARVMRCRFSSLRLYKPATNELVNKAVFGLSQKYLNKGVILRAQSVIDEEALQGKIVYVENAATDPRILYPAHAREEGIVSVLTSGMIYRGNPIGVLRVYTDRKQRFRTAQRNLLRAVAYQAATAIAHAQIVEERLRAAATQRELELAGALQARMISAPPPHTPNLECAVIFTPQRHVSGDFCDFLTLPDGRLAAVVADVSGKGVPAALLTTTTRGALRAMAAEHADLGELITGLNRYVCRETGPAEFITLLIVAIDARRGRLSFCNAGHEPLLLHREGRVEPTTDGGIVLGVDAAERYHETSLALRPRDFVLLYTDGAAEAMNFAGEIFGRQRIRESLRDYGHQMPELCLRNIRWDLRRFRGLAEQSDDLTLVGIRVKDDAAFSA